MYHRQPGIKIKHRPTQSPISVVTYASVDPLCEWLMVSMATAKAFSQDIPITRPEHSMKTNAVLSINQPSSQRKSTAMISRISGNDTQAATPTNMRVFSLITFCIIHRQKLSESQPTRKAKYATTNSEARSTSVGTWCSVCCDILDSSNFVNTSSTPSAAITMQRRVPKSSALWSPKSPLIVGILPVMTTKRTCLVRKLSRIAAASSSPSLASTFHMSPCTAWWWAPCAPPGSSWG
mmetsp:Transcript_74545/g.198012  ORF Transcript_74545/g.198012 Transcript_74545/m.198012 type:complete len:236 (-) Transcript_74545:1126-1833(-)